MSEYKVKQTGSTGECSYETLRNHCVKLSKKNNSILYKLEDYVGRKLLEDDKLAEIRDIILTVSAEINKLEANLIVGDSDEGLQ